MTATLGLAFAAGILTVAAPCVLPLLPVVVGGAMVRAGDERRARWRPFIIAGSLVISVVLFTLLLKATTALLGIPPQVWQVVSGGIIVLLGIDMVLPSLWDRLSSSLRLQSRSGRDVTGEYPQLASLAADLADHHVILDGEVVALQDGVPSFQAMQNRGSGSHIEFWCFDILSLDGRDLTRAKYRDRRKLLETLASGGALTVPPLLPADDPLKFADERGFEGVVAKKWDSGYRPGRSEAWVKDKFWRTQEVVIGGWRAGEGGRTSGIGALLIGVPEGDGLQFVGRAIRRHHGRDKRHGDPTVGLNGHCLRKLGSARQGHLELITGIEAVRRLVVRPTRIGDVGEVRPRAPRRVARAAGQAGGQGEGQEAASQCPKHESQHSVFETPRVSAGFRRRVRRAVRRGPR